MPSNMKKRGISLLLALALVFSVLPVSAYAEETTEASAEVEQANALSVPEDAESSDPIETTQGTDITEETDALSRIRAEIDDYVTHYGLNADMTDEELAAAYFAIDEAEPLVITWADEITARVQELAYEEWDILSKDEQANLFFRFCDMITKINIPSPIATTVTGITGLEITDTEGTGSGSGTTYSATIETGWTGTKSNTITIKNVSGSTKILTFDYSITWVSDWNPGSHTFGDNKEGSKEVTLADKQSVTYTITSPKGGRLSTGVTLKNITLTDVNPTVNVTVTFNSSLGSVKVGNVSATSGTAVPDVSTTAATTLVATPASGSTFVGWIDTNTRALLSSSATYSTTFGGDAALTAMFSTSTAPAWFKASGVYWTDDLQAAVDYAYSNSDKSVVLMCSGTLPSDKAYTVKSGVKLLIPFSSSDSGSFGTEPGNYITEADACTIFDNGGIKARNFAFRTLTVPSGTTITCNGAINVNGQRQSDGQPYCGVSLGGYGKIELEGSSDQIIIESGASLYCYGYITGSGRVNVKNGGKLYELLQVCDWPGGSNASNWNDADKDGSEMFPLTNFYVQNVESKLKLNYGALAYVEAALTAASTTATVSTAYIGTDSGIFLLSSSDSYIERIYDTSNDRMDFHMYGPISVGAIKIYKNLLITKIDLDSTNYVLPVNSGMNIIVEKDCTFTVDKKIAILPGASVTIKDGGTVNLSGQLHVVDVKDWSASYFFKRTSMVGTDGTGTVKTSNTSPKFAPVPYVATLDNISPRTTALVRGSTVDPDDGAIAQRYYMDAVTCSDSGKLTVNGTLNITGSIHTTNKTSSGSANKAITGTGTIIYTGTHAAGTLKAGYSSTIYSISTTYGLGDIIGHTGTLNAFGKYTYYGTSNGWYNYKVTAVDNYDSPAASAVTVTSTDAAASDDSKKLIGYISYDAENGQSTFNFTTNLLTVKNGATTLTPTDGTYSLTGITADTELILTRIIRGTSIRAGDCLDIYFWVSGLDGEGYTAKFSDGKEVAFADWTKDEASGMYRFAYNGIVAREMPEAVSVAIYKDGVQVSETATESIEGYALRTLEKNENAYLRKTLVDMLNYGAAAQTYFGHNTANLANAELTPDQQGYGTQTDPERVDDMKSVSSTTDVSFAGANITAGTTLYLSFYFNGITDANKSNFKAVLTYTDHYGEKITRTIAGSDFKLKDGYYGPQLTGLAVADGRKVVTCKIYNGETLAAEAQSSIAGYATRTITNNADNTNLIDVCNDLMKFIDSAAAYFESL